MYSVFLLVMYPLLQFSKLFSTKPYRYFWFNILFEIDKYFRTFFDLRNQYFRKKTINLIAQQKKLARINLYL